MENHPDIPDQGKRDKPKAWRLANKAPNYDGRYSLSTWNYPGDIPLDMPVAVFPERIH